MNHKRTNTFIFCFRVFLGIHRNPNWKEFLKSCESFLKKSQFSTLTDLNPGFGRPWDMLGFFFVNDIFITLQKKSFGQKKFEFHARVQKWHFARIEKLPKWHFWTHAWNSKKISSERLLLKRYEDDIYKKISLTCPRVHQIQDLV